MRDVKLLRLSDDGTHVVLTHEGTGEEFALRIDDRLRGFVVSDKARVAQLPVERPSRLSPKEIQSRLRAGESSEEIAAAADVPLERVLRYAGPVLAEREYIAEQAQRAALRGQPGEGRGRVLGPTVNERLEALGVQPDSATWDAWRTPDGRWAVAIVYTEPAYNGTAPEQGKAVFSFDPLGRTVLAIDDAARWMVGDQPVNPPVVEGPGPRTPRDADIARPRLTAVPQPMAFTPSGAPSGTPSSGSFDSSESFDSPETTGPAAPAPPAARSSDDRVVRPLRPAPDRQPGRDVFDDDSIAYEDTIDLSRTLRNNPDWDGRAPSPEAPVAFQPREPFQPSVSQPSVGQPSSDPADSYERSGDRSGPVAPEIHEPEMPAPPNNPPNNRTDNRTDNFERSLRSFQPDRPGSRRSEEQQQPAEQRLAPEDLPDLGEAPSQRTEARLDPAPAAESDDVFSVRQKAERDPEAGDPADDHEPTVQPVQPEPAAETRPVAVPKPAPPVRPSVVKQGGRKQDRKAAREREAARQRELAREREAARQREREETRKRELAEREAADRKAAEEREATKREAAEREAAAKREAAAREAAERKARERAEQEAADRKAAEDREAAKREAAKREAAERKARERAEQEAADRKAAEDREAAKREAAELEEAAEREAEAKREAEEAQVYEPEPEPKAAPTAEKPLGQERRTSETRRRRAASSKRKGSVPSWDDILFGGGKK